MIGLINPLSFQVFLKESLEVKLEKERIALLQSSVITIQRHVRAYLVRKRYRLARQSAIKIQSVYRGYKVRSHYTKVRRGVIKAQANWRMKRQRREYEKVGFRKCFQRMKKKKPFPLRISRSFGLVGFLRIKQYQKLNLQFATIWRYDSLITSYCSNYAKLAVTTPLGKWLLPEMSGFAHTYALNINQHLIATALKETLSISDV